MIVKIPLRFYIDHFERDLPTPDEIKINRREVWIETDDPAFLDLLGDAKYYADRWGPDGAPHINAAAKAMLKALERQSPGITTHKLCPQT